MRVQKGEQMSDLIDRNGAINALLEKGQRSRRYKLGDIWELNFDEIKEVMKAVPSVEPERKTGEWIALDRDIQGYTSTYECSECWSLVIMLRLQIQRAMVVRNMEYEYCPYCGCKMEVTRSD